MKKRSSPPKSTRKKTASQTHSDAVCLQCGCLCDDIEIQVDAGTVTSIARACERGRDWFANAFASSNDPPEFHVGGKPVTLTDAIEAATKILRSARFPLLVGMENANVETQRQAFETARLTKGILAPASSSPYRAMERAIFEAGGITATLGEIRNRADLVLVWNSDPVKTHPRHLERYSLEPTSRFLPRGRADRTLIVIESRDTSTSSRADEVIRILPGSDCFAVKTLHMLVRGLRPDAERVLRATGVELATWTTLADRLLQAKYGAALYDPGEAAPEQVEMTARGLVELLGALNDCTAFVFIPLGEPQNPTGSAEVVTWMGGVSGFITFVNGLAKQERWIESEVDLLSNRMVDAVLFLGRHSIAESNPTGWQWLGHIPTIVLASDQSPAMQSATVSFRTKALGISDVGTVFRSDGVSLPTRCLIPAEAPSEEVVLRQINARLASEASHVLEGK